MNVAVGDILVGSYSYNDFHSYHFYKVLKASEKSIRIVECGNKQVDPGKDNGLVFDVVPDPSKIVGSEKTRRNDMHSESKVNLGDYIYCCGVHKDGQTYRVSMYS